MDLAKINATSSIATRKAVRKLKDLRVGTPFAIHSAKVVNSKFGEAALLDLGPDVLFLPQRVTEVYLPAINELCDGKYAIIFQGEVDIGKSRPLASFRIEEH
ncbi:unnamed protein product [Acanthoscelides obtectus]|uniref:Uncharacterized protein n=1 Tax=Acanthoscelides obtectus TaxID=200917 RepID=A0A9P0PZH6_ACAOB|nr:unnamed protein product [Acanthoscelides obtectus]CAK1652107.1 hypothetical protein AOBTE_LOCUS17686 [Acanthoscelides obtectus]